MRKLLSIVRLTLANAIRMKVAIVIIVFLAIVVPTLPFVLKTDDTQKGHVQITLTYGLGMVFLLLMVMTVFTGSASISNEKMGGQLQLLDTKPIRRWQIILGKWLGIMVLNTALVIFLAGATFGLTRFIGRASAGTPEEQADLRNSVLTARVSIKPEVPEGIRERVNEEYETRKKEGRIPDAYRIRDREGNFKAGEYKEQEYKEDLTQLELKRLGVVPYRTIKIWEFNGIRVAQAQKENVAYLKYEVSTTEARRDRMFQGRWVVGDRNSPTEPFHQYVEETTRSPHELAFPVRYIKPDGTVDVSFHNYTASDDGQRGINVVFNPDEGLELMYKRTGFLSNYVRYSLLVLTILGFAAMLSVVCSSFMSFPVAALLTFSIILNSYGLGTFKEFAYARDPSVIPTTGQTVRKEAGKVIYKILSHAMPNLGNYSMLSNLNSGRYIPATLVLRGVGVIVLLFGGIVYMFGCFIFSREELGA
jgi:hypothetical protein